MKSPLGVDKLLVRRLTFSDALGRPFRLEADLISTDHSISLDQLVGESVGFSVELGNGKFRWFHGVVSEIGQGNSEGAFACYHVKVLPWIWLLTRTADCRIFQQQKVPDILKAIFQEYGFSDVRDDLKRDYPAWNYCVQYRESDFNFVSRLMEQEGIYYYWRHSEDKHELVLVDDVTAHEPTDGCEKLVFRPGGSGFSGGERVRSWQIRQQLQPGIYALMDYNFEKPAASLLAKASLSSQHAGGRWEVFDYPGEYEEHADGEAYAKLRIQELQIQTEVAVGVSDARGVSVGGVLKLEHHPRDDQNREYLILSCDYEIGSENYEAGRKEEFSVQCTFTAADSQQQFRPARTTPKPVIQGPQTAQVVGPAGDEIYTDDHARVKVQFHWDRYGKRDQNSSCWVRVSQPWAGKGWGSMATPRIGQEVIVEFLEGDPDQPIITGRVYNGDNAPPYASGQGVVSGLKSNTHKGSGYNEMSMDDTAKKEKITIHAQYDMGTTVEHDDTQTIHNDRTITVDGKHTETIKKDTTIKITEGKLDYDVVAGTSTSHVKGAVAENYDDTQTTHVKNAISITSETAHIYVHGCTNIQLHVGASKLWMANDGNISLEGVNVTINGSASVTIKGAVVHSEAVSEHQTKGAIVLSEGSATNTIKGGMVMLNP